MAQWVRLCGVNETPEEGQAIEAEAAGTAICLARVGGTLAALDNLCPHREGPLGQGWVEDGAVVCPWHSWAFDVRTGAAQYPEGEKVRVFAVEVRGEDVMIDVASS